MRTMKFIGFALSRWGRVICVVILGLAVLFIGIRPSAQTPTPTPAPRLKVMKVGLGLGTITSTDGFINCGTTCNKDYGTATTVELIAEPDSRDRFSRFSRWIGDCTVTTSPNRCQANVTTAQWVKAEFAPLATDIPQFTEAELTPDGIKRYLENPANDVVNSPARFVAALPPVYKQNWILMSRSESLQTGTADSPRILLPSPDAKNVFTVGMTTSSSYPGAHPNAIEYMQWDAAQKNFRFHEIIVNDIPDMGDVVGFDDGRRTSLFPARTRHIEIDDPKCSKCHSTRNVLNVDRTGPSPVPRRVHGTDIIPPRIRLPAEPVVAKNKPNWDTYDSWGGMLPFNRDRIFQGSVEAAAFRKIFNLWTWSANDSVRSVLEQLELQRPGTVPPDDVMERIESGPNEGHIRFAFDGTAIVTVEPIPEGAPPADPVVTPVNYSFDRRLTTMMGTDVQRGGNSVLLHHTSDPTATGPNAEGRGVRFFDFLGGAQGDGPNGNLNAQRIVDELKTHRFAPGSVPVDIRPIALAIANRCFERSGDSLVPQAGAPALAPRVLSFFRTRNGGLTLSQMFDDTLLRAQSIPRRKADIQRMNLDRMQFDGSRDPYLAVRPVPTPTPKGLLDEYGGTATSLATTGLERLRQEVFRRPPFGGFLPDSVIGGVYVDREDYLLDLFNTERVTLYRYFLEPLGVAVDKWSLGVRGRSRTYSFADVFDDTTYTNTLLNGLKDSLNVSTDRFSTPVVTLAEPFGCRDVMEAVNISLGELVDAGDPVPTYTDIQRIFNKSCIECHGGLLYPPYGNFVAPRRDGPLAGTFPPAPDGSLDLTEEEYPIGVTRRSRLERSHAQAVVRISIGDPLTSELYTRIKGTSTVPRNENCPGRSMPCGGPWLSDADINTIERWIGGYMGYSEGDPHLRTIDGINYDFQSAGEFVLLRGENLEIQTRQIPIDTGGPLGPNEHTGLSSCVSLNGAVAVWIHGHRITYQPNLSGQPDPSGLQLRIDGKLTTLTEAGIPVGPGVRIVQTTAPGGIRIEAPGGSAVLITPRFWEYGQVWHLDVNLERVRATEGIMGAIAPGSWLPALPDGASLGPKPTDLHQRYVDLYERFETAWRVTDEITLFDYAPGTSTGSFTIESWPIESPQTCQVPRLKGVPAPKPPLAALPLATAQQACAGIAAADRKANCIKDVMVTGDTHFATTYLLTDQIQRNAIPAVPSLTSPLDLYDDNNNKSDVALPVTFTWNTATDPDGDVVTYRHCVWAVGQLPDTNKCEPTAIAGTSRRKAVFWSSLLVLVLCLLLLLFLLFGSRQRKPVLLVVLAIAVLASASVAVYLHWTRTRPGTVAKTLAQLEPGRDYSWKVIAEDGKGGITESETRRFKTR